MDRGANLSDIGLSFSTGRLLYFAAAFFFAAQYAFMLAACFSLRRLQPGFPFGHRGVAESTRYGGVSMYEARSDEADS